MSEHNLIKAKTEKKDTNETECFLVRRRMAKKKTRRWSGPPCSPQRFTKKKVEDANTNNKSLDEIIKENNLENLQSDLMRMQRASMINPLDMPIVFPI